MNAAAIANEVASNIGQDYCLADFEDADYLDTEEAEGNETAARQALNLRMAEWWGA